MPAPDRVAVTVPIDVATVLAIRNSYSKGRAPEDIMHLAAEITPMAIKAIEHLPAFWARQGFLITEENRSDTMSFYLESELEQDEETAEPFARERALKRRFEEKREAVDADDMEFNVNVRFVVDDEAGFWVKVKASDYGRDLKARIEEVAFVAMADQALSFFAGEGFRREVKTSDGPLSKLGVKEGTQFVLVDKLLDEVGRIGDD